jgi:hypothetical protein
MSCMVWLNVMVKPFLYSLNLNETTFFILCRFPSLFCIRWFAWSYIWRQAPTHFYNPEDCCPLCSIHKLHAIWTFLCTKSDDKIHISCVANWQHPVNCNYLLLQVMCRGESVLVSLSKCPSKGSSLNKAFSCFYPRHTTSSFIFIIGALPLLTLFTNPTRGLPSFPSPHFRDLGMGKWWTLTAIMSSSSFFQI